MKILITGGAGYVGTVLSGYLLSHGHSVVVMDDLMRGAAGARAHWGHPAYYFIRESVLEPVLTLRELDNVDAIVHLAAWVGEDLCARNPARAWQVNVDGTHRALKLADSAANYGRTVRFLLASTCSNYGIRPDGDPAIEVSPVNPTSVYARSKVEAEAYIRGYSGAAVSTILRFATAFGYSPQMRFDLFLNQMVRDLIYRNQVDLYGATAWRPWIHVRDMARAVEDALAAPAEVVRGQTFNIGAVNERKGDLVDRILRFIPREGPPRVETHGTETRDYRVSFDKAHALLHFVPHVTLDEGIREVRDAILSGLFGNPYSHRWENA